MARKRHNALSPSVGVAADLFVRRTASRSLRSSTAISVAILPSALLAAFIVTGSKAVALADEPTRVPLEFVFDSSENKAGETQSYVSRLAIWAAINNGQAQRYVFDTGSTQFNTQIGPDVTGVRPIENSAKYVHGYGDASYGYLTQNVSFGRLVYLDPNNPDDRSKAITLPILQGREYQAGRIDDIVYTADHIEPDDSKPNLTKDPVTDKYTTDIYGTPLGKTKYYADVDARERIKNGKPADEDGRFHGTFGAGDYLISKITVQTGMLGSATESGYIVAANGNSEWGSPDTTPGCSPCVIVNLNSSLRSQFTSFAPWGEKDDKETYPEIFPGSNAHASEQYEGSYLLGFGGVNDKGAVKQDKVGVLLDTGTWGGGSLTMSEAKFASLEKAGVIFTTDKKFPGTYFVKKLTIASPNGDPVQLENVSVSIDANNVSADHIQFVAGLDFFLDQSVMYDLKNRTTAFTPYFVTADNFSTSADDRTALNRITPEMGSRNSGAEIGYVGMAGSISGKGDLEIAKNTYLRLTGTNTYEGETRIEKGARVELAGPGSIENSVRVVNNGTLDIQSKGNGQEEWGVSDTYNDARIRSLSGNGEVLLFDRALVLTNAQDTFAGRISDLDADGKHAGGKLSVLGGLQTLSGKNTFTGLTTVGANAGLVLSKTGSLSGNVSVSGLFNNDGEVSASTTVEQSGVATGTGTFADLTIMDGGTVVSGSMNETGKLASVMTVKGDFIQKAGSVYLAGIAPGIDPSEAVDRIEVSGNALIDKGARIELLREGAGSFALNSRYTLLTADKGISGTYDLTGNLYTDSPFIDFDLAYDPTSVYLDVNRSSMAFADAGDTFNHRSVANALEAFGPGNAIYDNILFLTASEAQSAFGQLSGEIHASVSSVLLEDSHFVRDAANARIRSAFAGIGASTASVSTPGTNGMEAASATTDRLAVWGHGFGDWGRLGSDGNAARLDYSTGGFLAGADTLVGDAWRVGLVAGYSRTSFESEGRKTSGSSDNYHLGLYAGTQWDQLGFRSGLAYSWHRLDTKRTAAFMGFADSLSSDRNAGTLQAFGELGYRFDTPAIDFEPYANLTYVHLDTDGFRENGGEARLHGSGQSSGMTLSTLGLRASSAFTLGAMPVLAHGGVGWRHAIGGVTPEARLAFSGGTAFDVKGTPIARNAALIEAGIDVSVTKHSTLGLTYLGQIASDAQKHGLNAKLQVRF